MGRALEMEASTASAYGGINIAQAKQALQEEDKFDKEIFRQRIKTKHREERLKAKAERRMASKPEDEDEEQEEDHGGDSDGSVDGSVADIIDALPDPDRIYGDKEDDDDEDFQRGPAPLKYSFKKLMHIIVNRFYTSTYVVGNGSVRVVKKTNPIVKIRNVHQFQRRRRRKSPNPMKVKKRILPRRRTRRRNG
jgi:hypothetical protein